MLLDAGADIEEIPFLGKARTVLGYCVKEENRELAQFLLSRGANRDLLHPVDCHDPDPLARDSIDTWDLFQEYQTTALGMVAFKGDIPMMQILLAARATVNRMDTPDRYLNPLLLAVAEGKKEAARLLLEAGVDLHVAERYKVSSGDRKISLFKRALEANDLPMCQLLLANGATAGVQLMEDHYSSQLWEHVKQNDTETVALLLQFGARANDLREGLPNSALGLAITQGNWTMISLLQSARATRVGHAVPSIASVETAQFLEHSNLLSQLLSANGQMILIEAIISQNEPLTSLLLGYGIDQRDRDIKNVPGLAQIIIGHGGQVTEAEINAIMWRVGMTQDHSVLLRFINIFGPFSLFAPTAVVMAVCSNDEAAVHYLLEAGVDVHGSPELYIDRHYREILEPKLAIYPYTKEMIISITPNRHPVSFIPLELAVIYGNRQIFQALLRATTWTKEEKGRALSVSFHFWDRRFVQDLLDVGADIHQEVFLIDTNMKRSSNPVKFPLSEWDTPLLRTLLTIDRIIDNINGRAYMQLLQNSRGEPLLQTAVKAGKVEMVSLILEAGVDIDEIYEPTYTFGSGGTTLYLAGEAGNVELMKILLKAGARMFAVPTPKYPNTTLCHAVEGGDLEVVNMVLAADADVNSPPFGDGGMTALQQAAKQGNMELVDFFSLKQAQM
ncbi:hypothetical protein N7516_005545 [Penicillium verrucosum]|uniref:uncharacterized protein n=1 Tax=Penicillium verrucosum TaxID=60171 RepID=UPI00254551FD|nr:uncharacterized protein N7516_005545 [Penicillium verrucosum]KAJ5945377.1 hypothetical protein N7516_005545 [Penicillium verrucosum]